MTDLNNLRSRVAASAHSLPAQMFHIAGHLHRHGVISGIGKALLKEVVFQQDVRGPKLVDTLFSSSDEHWLKFVHRLLDVETLKLFDSLYLDYPLEQGKAISRQEREDNGMLTQKSLVYGEVDYLAFLATLRKIPIEPHWTFTDLGSGTGRAVFIARLNFDFSRCTGIEILRGLHDAAADVCSNYNEFVRPVVSTTSTPLEASFFHCSLLDLDWSHTDVCFANSTCFDSALIAAMAEKASAMRPGSYFITFTKPLPADIAPFDIVDKERRNMSWGPATVYIHQRR
ncbi:hypothetical protein H310_11877 [Aphanomyces invadans]|uniref:Histone-lysine N-methyltransferase, H3 lysine-79 specific n=1 Tax=Aphanomyces invadans TaxID=157072 RepID=A0A024TKD1_9STRA|nr:hypothetical protein H310_11877 [Aphanomyces invadans]ETV94615.1 hypothetical protein H310_11877 [Aphanomyces invadans]|eukprot:XP_008876930.1 hypothetical protein H310_11877 [Aphanomyces invadans]